MYKNNKEICPICLRGTIKKYKQFSICVPWPKKKKKKY